VDLCVGALTDLKPEIAGGCCCCFCCLGFEGEIGIVEGCGRTGLGASDNLGVGIISNLTDGIGSVIGTIFGGEIEGFLVAGILPPKDGFEAMLEAGKVGEGFLLKFLDGWCETFSAVFVGAAEGIRFIRAGAGLGNRDATGGGSCCGEGLNTGIERDCDDCCTV
jgi:hypothetical protein